MGQSVRELKAALTARGIDFSHCCEKVELQQLLEDAMSRDDTSGGHQEAAASADSGVQDESFAVHSSSGRRCWVEFVDEGNALCHWGDGKDSLLSVQELQPLSKDELHTPCVAQGSFEEARAAAFASQKLLVAVVHSPEHKDASKHENLQTLALSTEDIAALIEENAIFWKGCATQLRDTHLQQLAPKGAPVVAMVLPLATDAMRVLSHLQTATSEAIVEAFVEALEALENHRTAAEARLLSEDNLLRQEQDQEFRSALAADQMAKEQGGENNSREGELPLDEQGNSPGDAGKRAQEKQEESEHLAKARRVIADEFMSSAPACPPGCATAKLVLRLSSGERVERTFAAEEHFLRVRTWAGCCPLLPEAKERNLEIPQQFKLTMAFPRRVFSPEDDSKTLAELGLVPNAALLLVADGEP